MHAESLRAAGDKRTIPQMCAFNTGRNIFEYFTVFSYHAVHVYGGSDACVRME